MRELEKPLASGDFEAQKAPLSKILERLRPLRLTSLDTLEFDCRTRLFTALLRIGRQPAAAESEKEARRKEVLALLGDIWKAVGDERRAALVWAAAGRTEATQMLQTAGEWQQAAQLLREQGKATEAARLLEQNGDLAGALAAYREAGDHRGTLRAALKVSDTAAALEAARQLHPRAARELLFKHQQGDLWLDLLVERGDWNEIASLYERAEQWVDAAQALERAGRLAKAAELYRRGGDATNAARCASTEAEARLGRGDVRGAGDILSRSGLGERAFELARETQPELAFQWLQQGGLDEKAIEFGQAMVERELSAGQPARAAAWLERCGEMPLAAQRYLEAGRPLEAQRVFESLGDWQAAGEAAARAGQRERAIELLQRAGAHDAQERVSRLLPPEPTAT